MYFLTSLNKVWVCRICMIIMLPSEDLKIFILFKNIFVLSELTGFMPRKQFRARKLNMALHPRTLEMKFHLIKSLHNFCYLHLSLVHMLLHSILHSYIFIYWALGSTGHTAMDRTCKYFSQWAYLLVEGGKKTKKTDSKFKMVITAKEKNKPGSWEREERG